jgi:GxxExxY protein
MPVQTSSLATTVIGCAIEVHKALGPGLLESAYERCLAYEFSLKGLASERQRPVAITYRGLEIACGYRVDFIVEGDLVVELKTVERLLPIHQAQVMTYLRLLGVRQGLLVNFNVPRLTDGVKSVLCGQRSCETVKA